MCLVCGSGVCVVAVRLCGVCGVCVCVLCGVCLVVWWCVFGFRVWCVWLLCVFFRDLSGESFFFKVFFFEFFSKLFDTFQT